MTDRAGPASRRAGQRWDRAGAKDKIDYDALRLTEQGFLRPAAATTNDYIAEMVRRAEGQAGLLHDFGVRYAQWVISASGWCTSKSKGREWSSHWKS